MPGFSDIASGTPIIEGQNVTFLWEGGGAPALIADFTGWEPFHLNRVGEKAWTYEIKLPINAYIEYAFLELQNNKRIADPHNPRTVSNGLGDLNHYFYMPEARSNPLIRHARGIPKGEVSRHVVGTDGLSAGKQRRVYLYQPPTSTPCPLLVILDGNDYLDRGKLTQIVDNLITQKRIQPLALALIAHGGQARALEYLCSEATIGFIVERVLPLTKKKLNLVDPEVEPGAYGIMGASLGGLMALYTGLRIPRIFGRVLSQAGGFGFEDHDFVVRDLVNHLPAQPLKVWMDVGIFDSFLSVNRSMHDRLAARGYQVQYREFAGGHNYTSWRNDIWRGLEWLFPAR
jgi:enterochelin esterase family protein